jgi:tetratricopeptide (TPR) repeat protein
LDPAISNYEARAQTYSIVGDHALAAADYTTMIDLTKRDTRSAFLNENLSDAYFGRGQANAALGNTQQAFNDYSQAIIFNDDHSGAYYMRGKLWSSLENHQEAVKDYSRAIAHTRENDNPFIIDVFIEPPRTILAIYGNINAPENIPRSLYYAVKFRKEYLPEAYFDRANSYLAVGLLTEATADLFIFLDTADDQVKRQQAFDLIVEYDLPRYEGSDSP